MFDALQSNHVLLMDGAMATELQKLGLPVGDCCERCNLTHADAVRSIHQAYADAGAQVLLTNTFQLNPENLRKHGLFDEGPEIARLALKLAREVGPRSVLGDIGPMPETTNGVCFPRPDHLQLVARWLTGVDAFLLETSTDASGLQAVGWLKKESPETPVLLSMTYRNHPEKGIATWDGLLPEDIAEKSQRLGAAGLGVNCGAEQELAKVAEVLRRYRQVTELPLFARPNAGTPVNENGAWLYPMSPAAMAAAVPSLAAAGAAMIGGCCGTTPAHIRAMASALVVTEL